MKPMLASDWDESKVKFPLWLQPKIDGVRALHMGDGLTGRSLKKHANVHTTNYFSANAFSHMDGEMAAENECHPALCRLTTSALNSINGQPWILWHVFDYMHPYYDARPYEERYGALWKRVYDLQQGYPEMADHLRIVPYVVVTDMVSLRAAHENNITKGYEGSILRDPRAPRKNGRSTVREGGLLRIKDFVEEEALVLSIEEGQRNDNEAKTNELGYTERSTHQENMVPNGMVGALHCMDVKTKKPIKVAAGSMSHDDRVKYFQNQGLLVGKLIKYKTFLHGVKDKPRFPTFQSVRMESDV